MAGTLEEKGKDLTGIPDDDTKDDLCYGDIVTIYKKFSSNGEADGIEETKDDDIYSHGFLGTEYGGAIDNNLMVLHHPHNSGTEHGIEAIPANSRGCLFRIVPKLNYLEMSRDMRLQVFKKEKLLEINANRDEIKFKEGTSVRFGDTVQLQHVLTGKFVTIRYAC